MFNVSLICEDNDTKAELENTFEPAVCIKYADFGL